MTAATATRTDKNGKKIASKIEERVTFNNIEMTASEAEAQSKLPPHEQNVLMNGVVMTRGMAHQLADQAMAEEKEAKSVARIIESRGMTYYDIHDTVEEFLTAEIPYAFFTSTMHFAIVNQIASAVKGIFYDMTAAARETQHIDNLGEFATELSMRLDEDDHLGEIGFDEYSGRMTQLSVMINLASKWEDKASAAAKAAGLRFKATPMLDQLHGALAKILSFDEETWANEQVKAKWFVEKGKTTEERAANLLKNKRDELEKSLSRRNENNQLAQPALRAIYSKACSKDVDTDFYQLPIETQYKMIESTKRSASKAIDGWARRKELTTSEYFMALDMLDGLVEGLGQVLNSPKYIQVG